MIEFILEKLKRFKRGFSLSLLNLGKASFLLSEYSIASFGKVT